MAKAVSFWNSIPAAFLASIFCAALSALKGKEYADQIMPMMQMRPKLPHRQETSPSDGKADPPTSKLRHRIKKRDNQTMGLAQGSGSPKASCNASNRSMSSWRHQISPRTVAATPYLRVHTSDSLAKIGHPKSNSMWLDSHRGTIQKAWPADLFAQW